MIFRFVMRCSLIQHKLDGMVHLQYGNNHGRNLQKSCGSNCGTEKFSGAKIAADWPQFRINRSCPDSPQSSLSKKPESQPMCTSLCLDASSDMRNAETTAQLFDECDTQSSPSNRDDKNFDKQSKIEFLSAPVPTLIPAVSVTVTSLKFKSSAHENVSNTDACWDQKFFKLPNFSVPLVPTKSRVRIMSCSGILQMHEPDTWLGSNYEKSSVKRIF
jgi:hypothetical protein